jgi:hypothetical protein
MTLFAGPLSLKWRSAALRPNAVVACRGGALRGAGSDHENGNQRQNFVHGGNVGGRLASFNPELSQEN